MEKLITIFAVIGFILVAFIFCVGACYVLVYLPNKNKGKEKKAEGNKKKSEHSKILTYFGIGIIVYGISFASFATIWLRDISAVPEIIIGCFGIAGMIFPFYFNKAKHENKIKLMKEYGIKIDKDTFNTTE